MSGLVANKGMVSPVYNSSKAALIQLTRSLAMEWGKKTFVEKPELKELWTNENMMKRFAQPEEFKGAALFLLSKASSFMTGSNMVIDGGHTACKTAQRHEGKLLLFMKEVVVSRPPRKGKRVTDDKKRHLEAQEVKRAVQRRKMYPDTIFVDGGGSEYDGPDSDVESYESTLRLQYNTVRGYVSAIQKLYDEQKSRGVNPAARPQGVASKALKRSTLATAWNRKRKECPA
ncbi:hypothetical protein HIM_09628 [Hirsutella minnesotensis 3608]|uniref:Uncharacterized protein n=1 Tax=Hirsutella minnesotensis 3608 TaxID=1043627 RepID=A0A0F7ZS95_9HYPO|nr:hypothetical protein HIM_09628 [Hirsutella minnesotensis 3608]